MEDRKNRNDGEERKKKEKKGVFEKEEFIKLREQEKLQEKGERK